MKFTPDWFLLGMIAAVALAWGFPDPGAQGGWMQPELLTKAGVALVFLLHGMSLSFEAMKAGMLRWKVHLVVQVTTFLIFPVIGAGVYYAARGPFGQDAALGFFYLCVLPSTVSSSVAMTALARGNVAAAVFNATLSSLIGIVMTPLWIRLLLHADAAQAMPFGAVVLDLMQWLLLPLLVGQVLRFWCAGWAMRNRKAISIVDRTTILLLVYTSFCDSVKWGVWEAHDVSVLVFAATGAFVLFFVVLLITNTLARLLSFPEEDRIAAVFCGSKKSLAQGIPMATLIFGSYPGIGLVLLPILLYHPLQLFLCGILARRWGKWPA